jgi:hypothetical protein
MRRAVLAIFAALGLAGCTEQVAGLLNPAGEAAAPENEEELAVTPQPEAGMALPPPKSTTGSDAAQSDPGPLDMLDGSASEADQAFAAAYDAPQIYMALQPDPAGPVSVILAIDQSRDNTPSDDPAVRLTPVGGKCNPQQLRYYNFPPERSERPVYGPDEAFRGITARELPDYIATAVTAEMLDSGLIDDPEESQPQNVCTQKLLQMIIIESSTG